MSTTVEGVYRNGELHLLQKPEGIEEGAVSVTLTNVRPNGGGDPLRDERLRRALAWLHESSWDLGGAPYPSREEIHDRARDSTKAC